MITTACVQPRKRRNLQTKLLRCNERRNPFILNCIADTENKIHQDEACMKEKKSHSNDKR